MILGTQLSQLHRPAEALRPELEAISLYRELAADNPKRYRADLAASLTSLGFRLSELGRPADALVATREAVLIYLEREEMERSGAQSLPLREPVLSLRPRIPKTLSRVMQLAYIKQPGGTRLL